MHISHKQAHSDTFCGLIPTSKMFPIFARLAILNSTAISSDILAHVRNQGNVLSKIQLYEYREVRLPNLAKMPNDIVTEVQFLGKAHPQGSTPETEIFDQIDALIYMTVGDR